MTVRRFCQLISVALLLFLYAPLLVVVKNSFNSARFGLAWQGFTFNWYGNLLHDELARSAVRNSLLLAFTSTVIATVLGSLLAFGWAQAGQRARNAVAGLLFVPVCVPDIVMGIALLVFFSIARESVGFFGLGLRTMVLAHVTFQIPFVAMIVRARLSGLDPALNEAARDLGASEWQRLWHVTIPLAAPGIIAGALLAFTLSLDDFVVSFCTSGPGSTTMPILIYSSVKRGLTPEINALSSALIAASVVLTLLLARLQRTQASEAHTD